MVVVVNKLFSSKWNGGEGRGAHCSLLMVSV